MSVGEDGIAGWAAEHLVDRRAVELSLEVPQGDVYGTSTSCVQWAATPETVAVEFFEVVLNGQGILADEGDCHLFDVGLD